MSFHCSTCPINHLSHRSPLSRRFTVESSISIAINTCFSRHRICNPKADGPPANNRFHSHVHLSSSAGLGASPLSSLASRLFLPPELRRHVTGARAGGDGIGAIAARRGAIADRVAATAVSADTDPRGGSEGGGDVSGGVPAGASGGVGSSGANWRVFVSSAWREPGGGGRVGAKSAMQRGGKWGQG